MLDLGALEISDDVDYAAPVFFVRRANPTPEKTHRLIWDGRFINERVCGSGRVALPSVGSAMQWAAEQVEAKNTELYGVTIDITDAYFHWGVATQLRRYLGVRWLERGRVRSARWTCLPFGLGISPKYAQRLLCGVLQGVTSAEVLLQVYLDDILLVGKIDEVRSNLRRVLERLDAAGLTVNLKKSQLEPQRQVEYLGMILDFDKLETRPTSKTIQAVRTAATCYLRRPTRFLLRRLQGKAAWLAQTAPWLRLWARELVVARDPLPLLRQLGEAHLLRRVWRKTETTEVFSDASLVGWGVACPSLGWEASGIWPQRHRHRHITLLETTAARYALELARERGLRAIRVRTDATTTAAATSLAGRTRSLAVAREIRNEVWRCLKAGMQLDSLHIPGVLNVRADALSRKAERRANAPTEDYALNRTLWKELTHWAGVRPRLDLFASRGNRMCRLFCSRETQPGSQGNGLHRLSSLTQPAWANPPWSLLPQVARLAKRTGRLLLVAPRWREQVWHRILEDKAIATTIIPRQDGSGTGAPRCPGHGGT